MNRFNFKSGICHWLYPNFTFRAGYIYTGEHRLYLNMCIWKWETVMGVDI